MEIFNTTGNLSEDFETAALESKIWSLLHILYTFRTANDPDDLKVYPFSSSAVKQEDYLRKHKHARENWLVLAWLQDSLDTPDEPPELRGAKWMYTRNHIQQKQRSVLQSQLLNGHAKSEDLVSQLDADASLREGKNIAQEDAKFDRTIFKYIFSLIRARKYEEACKVCEHTGNWDLLLTLKGQDEYYDSEVEGHIFGESTERRGIQNKLLWRRMCYKLTKAENMDPYEKGIYGILSSDLESVLNLSNTWELQLLAFMSYLVATESEEAMKGHIESDVAAMPIPKSSFTSSHEILEILAHSANPEIKKQSQHIFRQLLGSLIDDDVPSIVDALAENINNLLINGEPKYFTKADTMKVLRIATHLIIFLQQLPVSIDESQSFSVIIDAYIELLRSEGKNELIPLYVSYLSDDLASDTYSYLLAKIVDSEERRQQLSLAKKFGLDMPNTIRKAVKRVFDQDPAQYQQNASITFTSEVTTNDTALSNAVVWYKEASMWPDAIHSCVTLYRLFLGVGKLESAKKFGEMVPCAFISNKYDAYVIGHDSGPITLGIEEEATLINEALRLEFAEYGQLVSCIQQIQIWNEHYASVNGQGSNASNDRQGSLSSNGTSATGFRKKEYSQLWKRDAIHIVTSLTDSIHQLAATWMISVLNHPDVDLETVEQVSRLRTWYVPFLLMELLRILIEAQDAQFNFLKQAANLATFVAGEDLKLYQLFIANGSLNAFLGCIADACADGVIRGEEGIFG